MCGVRFPISASSRKVVEDRLQTAQPLGRWRQVTSLLAILAVLDGPSCAQVAWGLRVPVKTVATWCHAFCCDGLPDTPRPKPTGRPPKLPPRQPAALAPWMEEGPVKAGFRGACWRSPRIQQLIDARCGVYDHGFSMAPLLQHCGCSDPKAAFVSDHLNEAQRPEWRPQTWPQIVRLAHARHALLLCGDEASVPPWGTLTSTWARRSQPPQVKTAGKRKGSTVCGLMESFTGRLFYQGQAGRLNSAASMALLKGGLAQTTPPIIRMQEGARYHTSAETNACFAQQTARRQVFQLPTYAPD